MCTHEIYEFRPFSEEVIALRLGAGGGRLDYMRMMLKGVRTLVPEEGVAYIEYARTLTALH